MTSLVWRSLLHYWRTNLVVIAGVAIAVAALAGALLVGGSVRASLRALVLQRLGASEEVVASDRFFREDLADALASDSQAGRASTCPIISLDGLLAHARDSRRTRTVRVYGVDDRFWRFHGRQRAGPAGRSALVGSALAAALRIQPGDDVLLRVEVPNATPRESLFGRRDEIGRTVRLTCDGVLAAEELGEFSLQPSQGDVLTMFVPLDRLQRDLGQRANVNTVLIGAALDPAGDAQIRAALDRQFTLEDAGLRIRPLPSRSGFVVESRRVLLGESHARAALDAAQERGLTASGVLSHLANTIRANGRVVPYSVITAADLGTGATTAVRWIDGGPPAGAGDGAGANGGSSLQDEAIWLNEWAARDLGARVGDAVDLDYYRWRDDGQLAIETARFRLAGVVAIGGDVDTTLAPDVAGISDADDMRAWDPPFPMDLGLIRPADEEYWNQHRATPKAFVTLARGQQLWRSRFGPLSSVRVAVGSRDQAASGVDARDLDAAVSAFREALRRRLDAGAAGFSVIPVRARGVAASKGATDFGEYFVYFSFFLIAAAVLLAGLFFRLGVEQRVREIGVLQALGFSRATLRRLFLVEGAILSGLGSVLGSLGAVAYGGALVAGLRTWWIGAVGTRRVFLQVSAVDLGLGAVAGVAVSLGAVLWALRGLRHASARDMLAGVLEPPVVQRRQARRRGGVAALAFVAAVALLAGTAAGAVPDLGGFFGAGALLLVAALGVIAVWLRRAPRYPIAEPGWPGLARLGARHLAYRPGRSLLCIALIAFATFVIVSVEAFRRNGAAEVAHRGSGTGGFPLLARSTLPIVEDPNSEDGREALGIAAPDHPELARVRFVSFRERAGEDVSCLNLYAPQEPRILGAPSSFVRDGRFTFQASMATTAEQRKNPWLLLEAAQPDGAIPAIGDANTIQYVLHRGVGDEIAVRGEGGVPVRLRLVAALRDSVLQSELVIGEAAFLRAFPGQEGFRFFLLDVPAAQAPDVGRALEERLADRGLRVELTSDRLATYHRVESTYLSTFQSLGALGLLLGTAGLGAVLLRNVIERRREFALLRAVGYRVGALSFVTLVESVLLMTAGLAAGALCAVLAVVPAISARGGAVPFVAVGALLAIVVAGGLVSSSLAVVAVWRMPLLASIRSE